MKTICVKPLLFLLILISFSASASAQEIIDSLYSVWEKEALSEKEIMVKIDSVLKSNTKGPEISSKLAEDYKDLADKSKNQFHLSKSYYYLGLIKMDLAEFDKARVYLEPSLEWAKGLIRRTNLSPLIFVIYVSRKIKLYPN